MSENLDRLSPDAVKQTLDAMRPYLGNALFHAMARILDNPGQVPTPNAARPKIADPASRGMGMMVAIRGRRR